MGELAEHAKSDGLADKNLTESTLDGVIERCEPSLIDMHRPIVESESADSARVFGTNTGLNLSTQFDEITYIYAKETRERPRRQIFEGKISSYNINSFKGRIFLPDESRTVMFELSQAMRQRNFISSLIQSMNANALHSDDIYVRFQAIVYESRTGRIKKLLVIDAV